MKKIFSLALILILSLSLTAFAADFICAETSIVEGTTNVYVKEGTISLTFNEEVGEVVVSVKKAGAAFTGFTAVRNAGNTSVVDVIFDTDFDYATAYEIDFSGCKNASAAALGGTFKKLTFTTEAAPEVAVSSVELISGIGTGTITYPTAVVANDTLQGWTVNVTNNAAEAKTVTVVLCLYDVNGLLKKVVTSDKTIAAGADDSIGLGTVVPTTTDTSVAYSGGKAKLYIWDNLSNKTPFVGAIEYSID